MAELATIARPYAEALFNADPGQRQAIAGWLPQLASIAADPQVQQLAANPRFSADQMVELLQNLLPSLGASLAQNFVRTLVQNHRLPALSEIDRQFRVLKSAQEGSADAVVASAFPMTPAALAELQTTLERRFSRKLNLSLTVQPELIGGIRVVVGDLVFDTSVRARLEQMKVALTE